MDIGDNGPVCLRSRVQLLYCKRKLAAHERQVLQQALDSMTYNACGACAQMQDLELGDQFADVYARHIRFYA